MLFQLYGLYKRATSGACNIAAPSMMDAVGRARYNAWKHCSHMTEENAVRQYVDLVR